MKGWSTELLTGLLKKAGIAAGLAAVLVLAMALVIAGAPPAWADARGERPLQLQFDLFGVSLGWHINERIYIGATHQAKYESHFVRRGRFDDRDEIYDQRGVDDADLEIGKRSSLELRISPWEHGMYFAVGVLQVDGDKQDVLYDERARVVGDGAYVTGLRLQVRGKKKTALAAGLGLNHVFENGLSLAVGILIGLDQPDPATVEVEATNPDVLQSDIDKFRAEVEDDFLDTPILLHLAVGYNF